MNVDSIILPSGNEQPITPDTGESYDLLYANHVNPQWVKLFNTLGMNVSYDYCHGTELWTKDKRRILDFLAGYCVYNIGHNHPAIIAALEDELHKGGTHMLQSHVPELAAALASRLCGLAGGRLNKVFFTNSGSEGVETVIKFSRAHTGREGILYCKGGFHGLTCGALSLMDEPFWSDGFGPLIPATESVAFLDLDALEQKLRGRGFAAFIVEPVQGEGGIRVPPPSYLKEAEGICRRYGTLFALDEVQTGIYRTGRFLAAHHYGLDPDMVVLAKALSGGFVPCGAVLMTDEINHSVFSSMSRSFVHASTFGENDLAMRAGLATLNIMRDEGLGERSLVLGEYLRERLREVSENYEMVKSINGIGLLNGIEFTPPRKLKLRIPYEGLRKVHQGMFGMMVVMRLFREKNILTQICGNNNMVLKVSPPLVVKKAEIDEFVTAVGEILDMIHTRASFWAEALQLVRRAVNV